MNITEDYCSYEIAKLLKEKGFEGACDYAYSNKGNYFETDRSNFDEVYCLRPTHQMAMKWLREEHDLIIYVKLVNDGDPCHDAWGFSVYNKFTNKSIKGHRLWFKYEEAVEAALKYVLENLI